MNVNYNRLNLPDSVSFPLQGNTMKLEYLADGRRVRTTAKTYGTPLVLPGGGSMPQNPIHVLEEVRDGELVFRDGQLVELRTDGGYFSLYNDSLSTTQVRPYFYVTDYLGSVRMVCDGITGTVRQSLEYLPSGEVFRADNYPEQSYMFYGKELMTMHGWNMYDSNARFQHSTQPRFSSLDPLAEQYHNLSPYNYAGNDPVNAADPSGNKLFILNKNGIILDVVENGKWAFFDCFGVIDEYGHLNLGPQQYIESVSFYAKNQEYIDSEGKTVLYDFYSFRSGLFSKKVFEFLSQNTSVEWSILSANFSTLNYLSTSHFVDIEHGSRGLLETAKKRGIFILDAHYHNHPSGISIPSGFDGKKGDIYFADWVELLFSRNVCFYLYVATTGQYISYNAHSMYSDFSVGEAEGGTLQGPTVFAKKKP